MSVEILFSYELKDSERLRVAEIANLLKKAKEVKEVQSWEEWQGDPASDFRRIAIKNIKKTNIVVAIFTSKYLPEYFELQCDIASSENKQIIPLFENFNELPPRYRPYAGINISGKNPEQIVAEINELVVPKGSYKKKLKEIMLLKELGKLSHKPLFERYYQNFSRPTGIVFDDDGYVIKLDLYDCHLVTLPERFGDLNSLQELSLSENQLTVLPESFFDLKSLQELDLGSNRLTTLPESFGALISLQKLVLHWNALRTLPNALLTLPNLKVIDFAGNPRLFNDSIIQGLRRKGVRVIPPTSWNKGYL